MHAVWCGVCGVCSVCMQCVSEMSVWTKFCWGELLAKLCCLSRSTTIVYCV